MLISPLKFAAIVSTSLTINDYIYKIIESYRKWSTSNSGLLNKDGVIPANDHFDVYIPIEQIVNRPIPAHCRRIYFIDQFGRSKSML